MRSSQGDSSSGGGGSEHAAPAAPWGLTSSGRRRKPDRWKNLLDAKSQEHAELMQRVQDLEAEQCALRGKETLLLQVLHSLHTLVLQHAAAGDPQQPCPDAAPASRRIGPPLDSAAAAGAGGAAADSSSSGNNLARAAAALHPHVLAKLQQHEARIAALVSQIGEAYLHSHSRNGFFFAELLAPQYAHAVQAQSAEAITKRLGWLAGRIAILIVQLEEPGQHPATVVTPPDLHKMIVEYAGLVMNAMLLDADKFQAILKTDLSTLQPFATAPASPPSLLPRHHWLTVLRRLQLTDGQFEALSVLQDKYFNVRRSRLQHDLHQVATAQVARLDALITDLRTQQDLLQPLAHGGSGSSSITTGGGAGPAAAAAAAAGVVAPAPAAAAGAAADAAAPAGPLGAGLEQTLAMMRQWRLLALHAGIVTTSTLSVWQQGVFITAAFPSVPHINLAMDAHAVAARQQAQQEQEQQHARPGSRRLVAAGAAAAAAPPRRRRKCSSLSGEAVTPGVAN